MDRSRTDGFFNSVLDSLPQQIAVIDAKGQIDWVNQSWRTFGEDNGGPLDKVWRGTSYLRVCSHAARAGDRDGDSALAGIKSVIHHRKPAFFFEYPCHSPTEQRWFMMGISPLTWRGPERFVVTHQNITDRKLAELKIEEQAILDGLTGIANRRRFDDFLEKEWRRAQRLGHPISVALFDIDFFKAYNDNYGHMAGDECLRRVGQVLKAACRRPGDLAARYGGEEFAMVLGNTENDAARGRAEDIRAAIQSLGIPHDYATEAGRVTASVGVSTIRPEGQSNASAFDLVDAADKALYEAKTWGRNLVVAWRAPESHDQADTLGTKTNAEYDSYFGSAPLVRSSPRKRGTGCTAKGDSRFRGNERSS